MKEEKTAKDIVQNKFKDKVVFEFFSGDMISTKPINANDIVDCMEAYAQQEKQRLIDEVVKMVEERIPELKRIDAEFCQKRWDMERPEFERKLYREQSNEVTARRHELEQLLTKLKSIKP